MSLQRSDLVKFCQPQAQARAALLERIALRRNAARIQAGYPALDVAEATIDVRRDWFIKDNFPTGVELNLMGVPAVVVAYGRDVWTRCTVLVLVPRKGNPTALDTLELPFTTCVGLAK